MNYPKEQTSATEHPTMEARGAMWPNGRIFNRPRESLEPLSTLAVAALVEAASDVALVLDRGGVILDAAVAVDDLPGSLCESWIGSAWRDVVAEDSRQKVASLLAAADAQPGSQEPRRRHVNHVLPGGADLPVLYVVVPLGERGRRLAIGRDMRALASVQQRLVDAQHAMERDYRRLRHFETRYHLLFEQAGEALVLVDAATHKVIEANALAGDLLGSGSRKLTGQLLGAGFGDKAQRDLQGLFAKVRGGGRTGEVKVRLLDGKTDAQVSATLFMQDERQLFLVRVRTARTGTVAPASPGRQAIAQAMLRAPDGVVVTDFDGQVMAANEAFVELIQLGSEEQVRGLSIDRWLGRPGVDLSVLLATLRQQGTVRLFATSLRGELGAHAEVEISAVSVPDGDPPCIGFTVRDVGRRLGVEAPTTTGTPRSVEQLTQLVGRMPLKELVRESTDLIERLCIEAALKLTHDNRALASEVLGLSRQSLYVKLRRYGLGDLGSDDGST